MSKVNTVLVTGGASGIGRAIVEAILAEGWRAVVADLEGGNLAKARGDFDGTADCRIEALDVTDEEAVTRVIAACDAEFGPLTGVVNSAGIGRDVPALDTSTGLFREIVEVNLIGSFVVSREAARLMAARGGGAILNIASVSGIMGNAGRTAYGASKGAQITMTKVMAVDLARLGIRVNAIAPGPVDTPMAREMHTEDVRALWLSNIPQGRYGSPADIATTAVFLLDPDKSGFITGQTICVDGGFTIAGIMAPSPTSVSTVA